MEMLILAFILWISFSSQSYEGHAWSPLKTHHKNQVRHPLPIGQRVDGFLPVDKPARYYFAVNESYKSLTIRVTPCEYLIYWTLSFHPSPNNRILLAASSREPEGYTGQLGPNILKLFSFQGNGEESFSTTTITGGLYLLDLYSLESDTNFQIFVWENRNHVAPLPQLPSDPRVDVTSVEEEKVQLTWKPSLGTVDDKTKFEYCVFINKHYNFKTFCATLPSTDKPPWLHWDEKYVKKDRRKDVKVKTENHKKKAHVSQNIFNGHDMESNVNNDLWSTKTLVDGHRMCVGHWTNATITGLKPRTLYYFDVFAINPKDGTSAAYTGTFAETKVKQKIHHVQQLQDEEMANIFLKSKGLKIISMSTSTRGYRWLFVHSCLHKVHLQIIANGVTTISRIIQGAHNLKLNGNPKDYYVITLKSSKGGTGLVKLFATSTIHHLPFPNLSPDLSMSVSNISCSSVTLSWAGPGQKVKYCIYARHLEQNLDLKLIHKHQNSCLTTSTRSRTEKIICRQGGPQTLTEEQVTDLKPGKSYLLDLYFISHHNNTIKFPSRVVRTQERCT
ncbi:protein NDNF-like [Bombina bombina]|uniref:protein NDNF-like n=1 Tax=Bombina bombina TaxID=8345 RepID=UPI00235A98CA|nr:protein NDNF-like [Bombina bombina]